jgi:peptidyl-prolyl cis-trans isomerase SurA
MKSIPLLLILTSLLLSSIVSGQDLGYKVLMTIAGKDVTAGEFIRMYKKSNVPFNLNELDTYLNQFITFKQKVAEAIHEGYDTTRAFKTELKNYRDQLLQNYLTDPDAKEKLLNQAYQRSLIEINVWHILINCQAEASPDDTLKAWKKALNIRERIIKGESFEEVARGASDDPSVKINGGHLGYFTAFQMIMPFEDAMYSLKKDEISEPVRTPYGYHIIKVTDRRPSSGKIKVAHIMKSVPPGTSEIQAKTAEAAIDSIYTRLIGGASFSVLARNYSDHKESAANGGELNWFGTGEIITEFAEAAFSLKKDGDFTKPVRTPYGWHIIKRIERKPPGTFEESKSYLESKINDSYLNSISKKSFIEKLKKEYNFVINPEAFKWFIANTDTMIIKGFSGYNLRSLPPGVMYTFADQQLTTRDFADYIEKRGSMIVTDDPEFFINKTIDTRSSDQIIAFENSILEKKYPEFRYLMYEFHDGILLFEISSKKVWNKSQEDSTGLKQYWEDNKNKFLTPEGIEARIYMLKKTDGMKMLTAAFKKFSNYPDADRRMINKFISKGDSLLFFRKARWLKGADKDMDGLRWIKGYQETTREGFPCIVVVDSIIEPQPLPFREVQGEMISGYQGYLENKWAEQLKEKWAVKIDTAVLEEVRRMLKNE